MTQPISNKSVIRIWEHDIALQEWPPFPYIYWSEEAVKKFLQSVGFDLAKPIYKIQDMQGNRWEQEKSK